MKIKIVKKERTAHNRVLYVRRLEAARVRKTPVGPTPFNEIKPFVKKMEMAIQWAFGVQ